MSPNDRLAEMSSHDREHLRDAPGFRAWLEWPRPERRWFWGLSETTFTLQGGPCADVALHFDLEGRLRRAFVEGTHYLRGMDGRIVRKVPSHWRGRGAPPAGVLTRQEATAVIRDAHRAVVDSRRELLEPGAHATGTAPVVETAARASELLERAARFDRGGLATEEKRFRETYDRLGILPPDAYRALVLQVTTGCRYGRCTFCSLYGDQEYRRKTVAELRDHVRAVKTLFGRALPVKRGIFLAEANALDVPSADLAQMMCIAAEEFPETVSSAPGRRGGFSAFTDVFEGRHRDDEDLKRLAGLGLRRVYLGVESGDDEILRRLLKPASRELVLRRARALRDAGVTLGAIFLVGAGGRKRSRSHIERSLSLLRDLRLGGEDLVYLSRLRRPTDLRSVAGSEPLDEEGLAAEENELRLAVRALGVRVSTYDVDGFVYY